MPITNCGFPSITVEGTPPHLEVIPATLMLIKKGPTTLVEIGFDPAMFQQNAAVQAASGIPPVQAIPAPPSPTVVEALIDTGACESCIDEDLAQQLQLPLIDQIDGSGIGGREKFNVYLGHIRIVALNYVQYGRFMGVKLAAGGQPHKALLGRTVMQNMILVYDGRDGTVRLAS